MTPQVGASCLRKGFHMRIATTSLLLCALLFACHLEKVAMSAPVENRGGRMTFGQLLALLNGKHPRLDLASSSAMKRFHFTASLSYEYLAHNRPTYTVKARVVRDRSRCAVLVSFGGVPLYYTSNGVHSFLAIAAPTEHSHILVTSEVSVVAYGMLPERQTQALGLPKSMMYGLKSGKPLVFLRVFGAIHRWMASADEENFVSLPSPVLTFKWGNRKGATSTMHVHFDPMLRGKFPVQEVDLSGKERGVRVTEQIVSIGDGVGRDGPAIHRVADIENRIRFPWKWKMVKPLDMLKSLNALSTHGTSTPTHSYQLMRKRFLMWAMTPDSTLAAASGGSKSGEQIHH